MSNLSQHNNSSPLADPFANIYSHNAAEQMFYFSTRQIVGKQPGADCLLAPKMTSCRFSHLPRYVFDDSVAFYVHEKAPSIRIHMARLTAELSPIRHKHRSLFSNKDLIIQFKQLLHTQEKDSLLRIRVCNKIVGDAPLCRHWRTLQTTSFYFKYHPLKPREHLWSCTRNFCLSLSSLPNMFTESENYL